jgi:hypothetical protein
LLLFFERSLRNFKVEGCSMPKDKKRKYKAQGTRSIRRRKFVYWLWISRAIDHWPFTIDHSGLPQKISGVNASLMHSHHLFAFIIYQTLFDPAPVLTTFNAVHGHLRDAKFFR